MLANFKIAVTEVLYDFDGPAIFVGRVGYFDSLFIRIEDDDDELKFISCHTDKRTIDALREGRVSVYGAIAAFPQMFIVTTGLDLTLRLEAGCNLDDLSADLLPEKGAGLYPRFGECPDVIQEEDSYVSLYFRGPSLSRTSISLSTLRNLLKLTHDFLKQTLPSEMQNTQSSTIDFPIGDPALGSLMVSVKKPVFSSQNLNRRDKYKNASSHQLEREIYGRKAAFINDIEEVLEAANEGDNERLLQSYVVYEKIKPLLPTDDTAFSDVLLSSALMEDFQRFRFTRETSETLEKAYSKLDNSVVNERGKIIEINSTSHSLLLASYRGRTVTCKFVVETFRRLEENPVFKIGSHMGLTGVFERRPQRDKLEVRRVRYLGQLPAVGEFDELPTS